MLYINKKPPRVWFAINLTFTAIFYLFLLGFIGLMIWAAISYSFQTTLEIIFPFFKWINNSQFQQLDNHWLMTSLLLVIMFWIMIGAFLGSIVCLIVNFSKSWNINLKIKQKQHFYAFLSIIFIFIPIFLPLISLCYSIDILRFVSLKYLKNDEIYQYLVNYNRNN